jgi:hypothetical protein
MARKIISRLLDTVGDGSGTKMAVGNYLATAEEFLLTPAEGEQALINRMIVSVADTVGMQAEEYGNLGAALTNGIKVEVHNSGGLLYSLTDPDYPVKSNAGWGYTCYDAQLLSWGAGDELLVVRWTFGHTGTPVLLRSWKGEKLVVTLNDNFTGLLYHGFNAQGTSSTQI